MSITREWTHATTTHIEVVDYETLLAMSEDDEVGDVALVLDNGNSHNYVIAAANHEELHAMLSFAIGKVREHHQLMLARAAGFTQGDRVTVGDAGRKVWRVDKFMHVVDGEPPKVWLLGEDGARARAADVSDLRKVES